MSNTVAHTITAAQVEQFQQHGYFVLERVIPEAHLASLRSECQRYIDIMNAEMDAKGVDVLGISHRDNRYFISNRYQESAPLRRFLFSDLMAAICRATIGDTAYLFHEQYVVKAAEKGMKFGWHQDSGYVGYPHPAYVSCWCPLDDVNEENGTVYMLPYERAGTRDMVEHIREEGTNDKIGYNGADPGIPVIAPAGSIAVFSSLAFHRSGPNTTDRMRRVYLPQYSPAPIMRPDGTVHAFAEPFLRAGQRVA